MKASTLLLAGVIVIPIVAVALPADPAAQATPVVRAGAPSGAPTLVAAPTLASPTTLSYTGAEQAYTVPSGVTLLSVEAVGAAGGPAGEGGSGFDLTALLPVTPGQVIYAEVGQPGTAGGGAGFGGAGAAGTTAAGTTTTDASSGGGATDVRTCSASATTCPGGGSSPDSRLIVAGGGGGGGGGGSSVGSVCGFSPSGGNAGSGNGSGGTEVMSAQGTVILGSPDATAAPSAPAGGGSDTAPGTGGPSAADCGGGVTSYPDSAAGSTGSGATGGAGGTGPSGTGGGGGGGGGYFGGGGGASGPEGCVRSICSSFYSGDGGGGGSSFVASSATLEPGAGNATTASAVTFTPEIEIDTPANGAGYATGQVVDAAWTCNAQVTGCSGTTAPGQPIPTTPCGPYAFSVTGTIGGQEVSGSVSYTALMDVTTTSVPDASTGIAYRATLQVGCGTAPYKWRRTSGALPKGLKLKSTGTIQGIPYKKDKPGIYSFAVVVKDAASPRHVATAALTLTLSS